ncbi:hypothetical protein ABZX56_30490 [Streptomyces parvulus]|uniref:hypothetical protein n=1 Tax=Streptomyces parvulus TaxID=146923 RepID=UPI00339F53A8
MGTGNQPLWQWPLHSPRRLLATLTIAVAVVVSLSLMLNSADRGQSEAAPGAPAASASPSTPATPPPSSAVPAPSPSTTDYGQAIETAKAFVKAWANQRAGSEQAWYAGAAQFATDELARKLTTVDFRNVPANRIVGKLRLTDTGAAGRTEVAVPTDGGMVSVVLVESTAGWAVADIQPGAQAVE